MKPIFKTVLFFSLSYFLKSHFKLHFSLSSIGLSFFNKNVLFILFNLVFLLILIEYNLFANGRLEEEHVPCQSNAVIIQGEAVSDSLNKDELVEDKFIILVEKYAKEEDLGGEEEENVLDFVYNDFAMKVSNGDDTGWQQNIIQESVKGLELVVMEDLVEEEREIVCVQ